MDCEENRLADRSSLRDLRAEHPDWSLSQLATALSRSLAWIKKWLKRLAATPHDPAVLLGLKRGRKAPFPPPDPLLVERILAIRDQPPANLQRTPGPKTICYFLALDPLLAEKGLVPPSSSSTIWKILSANGRIFRRPTSKAKPFQMPPPLAEVQLDFKDVVTVSVGPEGKKAHLVEVLNLKDVGSAVLLAAEPREDFNAETVLQTLIEILKKIGLPARMTFDRDPRFVGSASGRDYPSAFVRFWHCLGVKVNICPPHRPDLNAFVERYHRAYGEECIAVHKPATLAEVKTVTAAYQTHYNWERPNQAVCCQNKPPRLAFPDLPALPALPLVIDPDRWLRAIDKRRYVRKVLSNGSIKIDKWPYYLGQKLAGQFVLVEVAAESREFIVRQGRQEIKRLRIKGLIGKELNQEEYLELIVKQARAEARWQR
jgi:transposase InsO family protein